MSAEIEEMLYGTLSDDAQLGTLAPGGVWRDLAPSTAEGTLVVFSHVSTNDLYALGHRAVSDCVYQVKAITPGETSRPSWDAAARIDALLTDAPLTMSAGHVLSCRRSSVVSLTEIDAGDQYQHAGGLYAITIQEQ